MIERIRYWIETGEDNDGNTTYDEHEGSTLGVVHNTVMGLTCVVIKCTDGHIREVPIEMIKPKGSDA